MNIKQILFLITLVSGTHIATASQEEKNEILTLKTKIAGIPLKRLLFRSPKLYQNNLYLKTGPARCTYIADKAADGTIKFVPGRNKKYPDREVKDLNTYIYYNNINSLPTDESNKSFVNELERHIKEGTAIYCPNLTNDDYNGQSISVGGILRNSSNCDDCIKLQAFIEQYKAQ